jgi:hypothetical protein
MYAYVNQSITSSLCSLARQMHLLRLQPPNPQAVAQSTCEGDPSHSPSSLPSASAPLRDSPDKRIATPADVHLGRAHAASDSASIVAEEVQKEQEQADEMQAVPFESSRWLAGRDKVTDKASRDEVLRSLEPLEVPEADTLTACDYQAALRPHLGFQLSIDESGIDHEYAGDGVWLEGVAEMGQVVAVHPGVVYSQAFHTCVLPYLHALCTAKTVCGAGFFPIKDLIAEEHLKYVGNHTPHPVRGCFIALRWQIRCETNYHEEDLPQALLGYHVRRNS